MLKQSYVPGPLQSGSPQPSASLVCRATPGLVGSWEVSNFSKNISADASEKGETWALQRVRSLERCHLVLPIPTPTRQTPSPECKVLMIPQWRGSPPLWCDRDSTEMSKDTVLGTVGMMLMSEMRQLSDLWGHRGPHLGVPLCLRGTPFTLLPAPRCPGHCQVPFTKMLLSPRSSVDENEELSILWTNSSWDFSGSPVVRTPHFHCRGQGSIPWLGN